MNKYSYSKEYFALILDLWIKNYCQFVTKKNLPQQNFKNPSWFKMSMQVKT